MEKKGDMMTFFVLLIIIILGLSVWLFYFGGIDYFSTEVEDFVMVNVIGEDEIVFQNNSSIQFYENLRYPNKRIGYNIEDFCDEEKKSQILETLNILEERTVLEFYPAEEGEIYYLCSEIAPEPENERHFVAGEGGPSRIIESGFYSVILEGKVSLFREDFCDNPQVALHETLHALGFDHSKDRDNIMYPVTNCQQTLDDEIVDKINELYVQRPLADLEIENIGANKSGKYLNFEIFIANVGLVKAEEVFVSVLVEGENIKSFSFDELDLGFRKSLSVTNLKIPRKSNEIIFFIDYDNKIEELSEDNNQVVLRVA